MRLVWAEVVDVEASFGGASRATIRFHGEAESSPVRAVHYEALTPPVEVGSRVLVNTTAVDLGLGTGGEHFIVAVEGHGVALDRSAPRDGHILKLRYTPMQLDVLAVEAPESAHHDVMSDARTVEGMPVVCCTLHSQVPLVALAIKSLAPDLRVTYCMTDQAALPLALSGVLARLVKRGVIDSTITCGQAFGGTLEAVTLHSGLLAARHVTYADVAIVGIGPGVVGTATPFGHGGIATGEALNAAAAVGGVPIVALRTSQADERPRHRPVSHHSLTALRDIALAPSIVPLPMFDPGFDTSVAEALESAGVWERHSAFAIPPLPEIETFGIPVRTMGRGRADDPAFFAYSYAAGGAAVMFAR